MAKRTQKRARKTPVRSTAVRMRRKAQSKSTSKRWSQRVTETSNALDLEPGVFTKDTPRKVALSLKRSAAASHRRKTDAFHSALSMLTFYINRAGKGLSAERRRTLMLAKDELRKLYGREPKSV